MAKLTISEMIDYLVENYEVPENVFRVHWKWKQVRMFEIAVMDLLGGTPDNGVWTDLSPVTRKDLLAEINAEDYSHFYPLQPQEDDDLEM